MDTTRLPVSAKERINKDLGMMAKQVLRNNDRKIITVAVDTNRLLNAIAVKNQTPPPTKNEIGVNTDPILTGETGVNTEPIGFCDIGISTDPIPAHDVGVNTDKSLVIPNTQVSQGSRVLPEWMRNTNSNNNNNSSNPDCNSTLLSQNASSSNKRKAQNNNIPSKKARVELEPVPFVFNKKAIMNLTLINVPSDVLMLLSFGPKFIPPILKIDKAQVLSDISKLDNLTNASHGAMRKTLELVQKYKHCEPTWRQTQINNLVTLTEAFIKENPDIMIDTSDKGKVTVIMTKEQYRQRVLDKLSNNDAYAPVLISQREKLMKKNYTLLIRCAEQGFIPHSMVMDQVANETQFSQVYGLVKVHKAADNYPARIINSNINVIGNKLSNILLPCLNKMNATDPFRINNSQELVNKLRRIKLKPNDRLFSLDVVDMFTNIPLIEAWEIIEKKDISKFTNMTPNLFKDIFDFITLEATEFKFQSHIYKMVRGLPMGVSTSPVIACLVTTNMLLDALSVIGPVTFICKYVDDILLVTDKENAGDFVDILNLHDTLKFKFEEEDKNSILNYLDVSLLRSEEKIVSKWYCKPYSSNRLINWFSAHDKKITIQTAVNFVKNMFNLTTDAIFHDEIEYLARDILHNNSFPKGVIDHVLKNVKEKNYPHQELPKFIGTSAPLDLITPLNGELRNSAMDNDLRFVNKTFSQCLANKVFSSRKDEEKLENRNFLVLELKCDECEFTCIAPIIYPIVMFKVFDIQSNKHPFYYMQTHIAKSHHSGFTKKTIRNCENKDETLRLAEIEASLRGVHVHTLAQKSNAEIVRKSLASWRKQPLFKIKN